MSHISATYHIIFGTHHRQPVIDIAHEKELYKFIHNLAISKNVKVWRIGGMPDHVHLLCDLPATISLAELMKIIKSESSKFLRVNSNFPLWRRWAEGYGAFSVDADRRDTCIRYIMNQKDHHRLNTFSDEYRRILDAYGLSRDTMILGDDK